MAKTKKVKKEKYYSAAAKVIAVILMIISLLVFLGAMGHIGSQREFSKYSSFDNYIITDAKAEKQDDGRYLITAYIKNDSAYDAEISESAIRVAYGSYNTLPNEMQKLPDGSLYSTLKYTLVPAGRTVEYKILITPPYGVDGVRLTYSGISYDRRKALGLEYEQMDYAVELK